MAVEPEVAPDAGKVTETAVVAESAEPEGVEEAAEAAEAKAEAETVTAEAITEAPATETPVAEATTTEAPVAEAPVAEAPVAEVPADEAAIAEAPVAEAPVAEATIAEAPVSEPPADETPTVAAPFFAAPAVEPPAVEPPAVEAAPGPKPRRRRALFLTGWLASALAVGAGVGFGILAVTGTSVDVATATSSPTPSAPAPAAPSPNVTAGVRSDGTHYGSLLAFLLPVPDGYHPGPDEGELGNDSAVRADQADPTVSLLFGDLPASDMSGMEGAVAAGHMSGGAVRTYANEAGTLDLSLTVLQLDPAVSAKSTDDFLRIVKASKSFRTGPPVPNHPDALCVLPTTHVGDPLDTMTCLGTVGDTFTIARAEGVVPLDTTAVTGLFGRQLDVLKNGLGT